MWPTVSEKVSNFSLSFSHFKYRNWYKYRNRQLVAQMIPVSAWRQGVASLLRCRSILGPEGTDKAVLKLNHVSISRHS